MSSENSLVLCSLCDTENRIEARFCKNCGNQISTSDMDEAQKKFINCPKCNQEVKKITKYCSKCGFNIRRFVHLVRERKSASTALDISRTKYAKESILLSGRLKEAYDVTIKELHGLLNYQKCLFERSDRGMVLIEEDTANIIIVNKRFEEITGNSREELVNRSFISVISNLNPNNEKFDMKTFSSKPVFFIFNRDFEKFTIRLERNSELFDNNCIFVIIDEFISGEESWLKGRKSGTMTKKLFLVAKIAEEINSSLDLETILNNTLERLMEATMSDSGLIMVIDENKQLMPVAYNGLSDFLIKDLIENPVKAYTGSSGKALSLGRTVEAKLTGDGLDRSMTGVLTIRERLSSIVTVPLKSEEESIGIISLGRRKVKEYSGKELELLDAIVNHVVIAINNASLYEQVKFQLEELKEKTEKLEELEEIKERLTRMLVHDLKNPLSVIMTYSQYLKDSGKIEDGDLLRIFEAIYSNCQDILNMVMNLLEIGKIEDKNLNLDIEDLTINEILDDILDKLKITLIKKDIAFIKTISKEITAVKGDRNLLQRVITNLLDNAIKHTEKNGKIEFVLVEKEKEFLFCISDEGKGIPEKYHKKIFEPYFSLDYKTSGIKTSTGIGLSFCKLAIEAHGGRIWVENNMTRGCTFYFTLPGNIDSIK